MLNRLRHLSRQPGPNSERGQALVLIALAFIGLAAFIGLTVDAGILFSQIGQLRRATDAASLAAANQFREGRSPKELSDMAFEMLELNGLTPLGVVAKVCDLGLQGPPFGPGSAWDDSSLCAGVGESPRKYVRVETQLQVNFAFLPIIGWDSTVIQANSISEAASVDLVLILDVSPSMSYNLCDDFWDPVTKLQPIDNDEDGTPNDCDTNSPPNATGPANAGGLNSESDVQQCINNRMLSDDVPGDDPEPAPDGDREDDCHPFEEVRDAAHLLVDRMYFPYDRIGIVTFATLSTINLEMDPNDPPQPCGVVNPSDPNELKVCADNVIDSLDPELEAVPAVSCPNWGSTGDPRGCMSTNTGAGQKNAFSMYCEGDIDEGGNGDLVCDRNEMREEAVWVAVILSDGIANAANSASPPTVPGDWICPVSTWGPPTGGGPPYCSDGDPNPPPAGTRHASGDVDYDADDYARDWADALGCPNPPKYADCIATVPAGGQDVVIFSIGLGAAVTNYTKGGDVDQGEQLLRYIAAVGDDGDPSTDPCASAAVEADCGNYYFVLDPSGGELLDVFEAIASRIFTRITH